MTEIAAEAESLWGKLAGSVPDDDPLKADAAEYINAGEWGIACEAMAILAKRYKQEDWVVKRLEPLMEAVILAEEDE